MGKFTDEEMVKIKDLQNIYADIVRELGQNELQINDVQKVLEDLTNQRSRILEQYQAAKNNEQALVNEFTEKYGEGTIDMNTGEFTPSNPQEN